MTFFKRQALAKRNGAILLAKREYQAVLREIEALNKRLNIKRRGRPPRIVSAENALRKVATVAPEVLAEGGAMTIAELAVEVQRHGCRSLDDPRWVARAIRNGLQHYGRQLKRDVTGAMVVVD